MYYPNIKKGLLLLVIAIVIGFLSNFAPYIPIYPGYFYVSGLLVAAIIQFIGYLIAKKDNVTQFNNAFYLVIAVLAIRFALALIIYLSIDSGYFYTILGSAASILSFLVLWIVTEGCIYVTSSDNVRNFGRKVLIAFVISVIISAVLNFWSTGLVEIRLGDTDFTMYDVVEIIYLIADAIANILYFILLFRTYRNIR